MNLESVTNKYGGFQFDLQLPAGISAVAIAQADRLKAIAGYVLTMNLTNVGTNTYTVLGYNTSSTEIAGNNGDIAYITLRAGDGPTSGNALTANITGVVVSTVTPTNIDAANSSFTINVTTALTEVVLYETATSAPAASNGAVNVTVNRSINANEWSTICLPFDMTEVQVKAAFGNDVQLANLTSWSYEGTAPDVDKITLGFTDVTAIEKHKPYIIKVKNAVTSFKAYNVYITTSDNVQSYATTGTPPLNVKYAMMMGSYATGTVPAKYFFLSNNNFYYSTGVTPIKGFRATFVTMDSSSNIIALSSYNTGASRIAISFSEEETTGIRDNKLVTTNGKTYNLSGQQVEKPAKGLYIQDGKKVIIK